VTHTTPSPKKPVPALTAVRETAPAEEEIKPAAPVITEPTGLHSPLCFVDGHQTTYEEFKKINAAQIKSVKVLKGDDALLAYGDKGRNGAILVTLNDEIPAAAPQSAPPSMSMKDPMFVFFIDGKPVSEAEQAILAKQATGIINNPDIRESIIVITGKEAIKRYGEKAVSGVFEVYLKKQPTTP